MIKKIHVKLNRLNKTIDDKFLTDIYLECLKGFLIYIVFVLIFYFLNSNF